MFSVSCEDFLRGFKTDSQVLFEDGVVATMNYKEIVLLRYLIEPLKAFNTIPLTSDYNIQNYYSNGLYVSATINRVFEAMFKNLVLGNTNIRNDRYLLSLVFYDMQKAVLDIYNNVVYNHLECVTSINILYFLEIQYDKRVLDAIEHTKKELTAEAVRASHNVLKSVMYESKYDNNPLALGYRSRTYNPNQVNQMLASRGFLTELNSAIFKFPVATSFTIGLYNPYDFTIESRAGAKALFVSTKGIKFSEYTARELQMVTMVVERLVDGDCGSKDYVDWYVKIDDVSGKSDLPNMLGKHYYDEVTKTEKIITADDTHLIGKTIKLRTAMKCNHKDKRAVCSACFGELAFSVPLTSSLGHYATAYLTSIISQAILSTKHLAVSAESSKIVLDGDAVRFFMVKDTNKYMFKANALSKVKSKYYVSIDIDNAYGVKDLVYKDMNVYKLDPQRVSRIKSFCIKIVNPNDTVELINIPVQVNNRAGYFTYEFLQHIIDQGFILTDENTYDIPLDNWDTKNHFIVLPEIEFNFLALATYIKNELKYMTKDKAGNIVETQESLLQKLFYIVNRKLNINIALLEVIIYAFSVKDGKNGNYDLARGTKDPELRRIADLLFGRSLGAGYGYENLLDNILNPKSFNGNNSVDHVLDSLLKPKETVIARHGAVPTRSNIRIPKGKINVWVDQDVEEIRRQIM